ncbi:MAG: HypC/HybG/HupF family hydrogenase formation chaperone [Gammaproteobacteria bacterium]|nr:HypC/HybG/HupF family hydrogenase formation chaperone [Gammaproteobacteria bacterium]
MCIGIPMQVIASHGFSARCEGRGQTADLNMLLVGPQEPGTWVLNFLGSAREVLSEEDARRINDALDALEAVMRGDPDVDIDAHFADLTGREPTARH